MENVVTDKEIISVFGLGFVGLTTALGFAHHGYNVYGIDVDEEKKQILRDGKLPFIEKGLDTALNKYVNKNFIVCDNVKEAVSKSDFIFYCVGTPYSENGEADLKYLMDAVKETLDYIDKKKKTVLIIKSTVPPTTTKDVVLPFIENMGYKISEDLLLANNPEFLREGHCWDDFINPDRIVIGNDNHETFQKMKIIYDVFKAPILSVSYNTGEFIKYLSNTLLATMISYSNEMSNIADAIGSIDISKAFKVLHMDKRWNNCDMKSYVYPGCGYGGYCLPKDTKALYATAKKHGVEPNILCNAINLNDNMPEIICNRIIKKVNKTDKIGILGLSFKPDSDDVRESTSAKIIKILMSKGYTNIIAYDPVAVDEFKNYYNFDIEYVNELNSICERSNVLIILTAWNEFSEVKKNLDKPILDFRYME